MAKKRLVVIGGGAAGFFCAVNAARMNPALEVTIIEKTSRLLSKVKVSGGGRCNVTHACFNITDLLKKYPRGASFLKKSFTVQPPTLLAILIEVRAAINLRKSGFLSLLNLGDILMIASNASGLSFKSVAIFVLLFMVFIIQKIEDKG